VAATVFQTTDLDVASTMLSELYSSMRLSGHSALQGLRVESRPLARVRLDRVTLGMHLQAAGEPLEVLALGRVRDGHVSYRQRGEEAGYGPGDVFLGLQATDPWEVTLDDLDGEFAFMEPVLLEQVASGVDEPVRLLAHDPVSHGAGALWWRTYTFLKDSVASSPDAMASPLVVAHSARLLAAATLTTFPNTAVTDPTFLDRHDAHPDTLRRAIAFIEANPELDLTVADIAGAAFVTTRAVQLAFRRHLDTTPMAYLRRVRLDRAHHDLLAATPGPGAERDTVTAIATRWGFLRPGAFAARYRAAYGQLPSQTLNQ
jgi:AraC-like DNA-binding protein